MGYFTSERIYASQPVGEAENWTLEQNLSYVSDHLGLQVTAPKGFTSDLASIPWFFRRLLPKSGEYNAAAFIHDYLCRCTAVARVVSDELFYQAMRDLKVPAWKREIMYTGVRIGSFWHKPDPALCTGCEEGGGVFYAVHRPKNEGVEA